MGKGPTAMDRRIGEQIRFYRRLRGFKQEVLGRRIGVSGQQFQKYEKGVNRIGAGHLHAISRVLNVPIAKFFEHEALPVKTDAVRLEYMGDLMRDFLLLPPAQREAMRLLVRVLRRAKTSR